MPSRLIKSTKHKDFVYSGWHPARRDSDFCPPSRSNMGDLRSPENTNQSNNSINQCPSVNSANVTSSCINSSSHSLSPEKEKNPENHSFQSENQSPHDHSQEMQWDHSFDQPFSQETLDQQHISITNLRTSLNSSLEIIYRVKMLAQDVNSLTTKANATLISNMSKLKTLNAKYDQLDGTITLSVKDSKDIYAALGGKYDFTSRDPNSTGPGPSGPI